MASIASSISELEEMLQRVSAANRSQTLGGVIDLFLQGADRYRPEHIDLFDKVLSCLIVEMDTKELKALSKRLASCAKAPVATVTRLARDDDPSISEPVLLQSLCLEDAVLGDIARTKSQSHLLAIACRAKVSAVVTELLIERGDDVVVRYVANNPGAEFSEAGFLALVKRSKSDGALAEQLKERKDIRRPQRQKQTATTIK